MPEKATVTVEIAKKREMARISDIQQRLMKQLEEFEDRYGMKKAEFHERINQPAVLRQCLFKPLDLQDFAPLQAIVPPAEKYRSAGLLTIG